MHQFMSVACFVWSAHAHVHGTLRILKVIGGNGKDIIRQEKKSLVSPSLFLCWEQRME